MNVPRVRAPIRRGQRSVEALERIVVCDTLIAANARIFAKCIESNLAMRLP